MKKIFSRILILLTVLALALIPASMALAATDQNVTITAEPSYIDISNAPSTWTMNGIDLSGIIAVDTIYYANPTGVSGDTTAPSATVVDSECYFTVTNSSSIDIDLTNNCGSFSGGDANMTNSDTDGSNGATTYGMFSWYEGMTYSAKVVTKSTASAVFYDGLTAVTADLDWGCEIETQTNAWAGGDASTATLTMTATAD